VRIGELAATVDLPAETVRFYEKRGLLDQPRRTPSGYRDYDDTAPNRLRFIRSAQAAGLTLSEIHGIVQLRSDGMAPCGHVEALLSAKLADIRHRQRQLAALEHELDHLLRRSQTLDPANCAADDICHVLPARRHPNDPDPDGAESEHLGPSYVSRLARRRSWSSAR